MKALITGAAGFVGTYLAEELENNGIQTVGTDLAGADRNGNLLDVKWVENVVAETTPDYIFHLAGQSSVGFSWENPQCTIEINVNGTLNLLDAVRSAKKAVRMVIIGTSDEYGPVAPGDCPIKESLALEPVNPYAVSKAMQEQMALLYQTAYDLDLVATRSFNHTGPGQKKGFVIPDFASQIAELEKHGKGTIRVGNLSAKRDFSDVRDIVRAYRLLAQKGKRGEIYNVGSGQSYAIQELLDALVAMSDADITIEKDPEKFRPIDLPVIQGDIQKLTNDTGYVPEIGIEETLKAVLDFWRKA
ncbi:GDP-mannose 4,6-dehydratase [Christensenella timonensis]|uniref:GDP-mannose 4,6-dehydratase n=1 Tax=Christensenella timonensis TaxID=1816678 RepID=UPI000836F82D|nr:GDP-mannose 4,6-dehydratase [Christensenella timonensis]